MKMPGWQGHGLGEGNAGKLMIIHNEDIKELIADMLSVQNLPL